MEFGPVSSSVLLKDQAVQLGSNITSWLSQALTTDESVNVDEEEDEKDKAFA